MDDAGLVRDFQRLGDLPGDRKRLVEWQRAPRQPLREILALDQFEHQGPGRADLLEAVDLRDVRVVQRGEGPGFTLEAGEPVRIADKGAREDLERHVAPEPSVAGAIHLAHAPGAQGSEDFVVAENRTGTQAHLCGCGMIPRHAGPPTVAGCTRSGLRRYSTARDP